MAPRNPELGCGQWLLSPTFAKQKRSFARSCLRVLAGTREHVESKGPENGARLQQTGRGQVYTLNKLTQARVGIGWLQETCIVFQPGEGAEVVGQPSMTLGLGANRAMHLAAN